MHTVCRRSETAVGSGENLYLGLFCCWYWVWFWFGFETGSYYIARQAWNSLCRSIYTETFSKPASASQILGWKHGCTRSKKTCVQDWQGKWPDLLYWICKQKTYLPGLGFKHIWNYICRTLEYNVWDMINTHKIIPFLLSVVPPDGVSILDTVWPSSFNSLHAVKCCLQGLSFLLKDVIILSNVNILPVSTLNTM